MQLLENTVIMPLEGTMDSFAGGLFSFDGEFIEDSLLHRGTQAILQKPVGHLHGTYIYGGCLFGHFGHFIWESLARLYAIRQCNAYPILFISPNDKVYDVQKRLFQTIGIKNEILLVKKATSVENLIYSPPGSSLEPLFITDAQINALQYLNFYKNKEGAKKKIWLSRARLKYGRLLNEQLIEEELKRIGYDIIYPELLTLREQVRLLSSAAVVAGCDGSAFFSLLFAKEIQGKFFVFNRRESIPPTLAYVFQKRNVQFEQHESDLTCVSNEWPISLFHHPDINQIVDILKSGL